MPPHRSGIWFGHLPAIRRGWRGEGGRPPSRFLANGGVMRQFLAVGGALCILAAVASPAVGADGFSSRVTGLIDQLTLDEKIALTSGSRDPSYHGQSGY